ncbi:hypothetical protein Q31b_58910 [Novipirellula aureliae]|uniref:Uncharacterized protein n=1 Tax=Novipirellula aureliae TaxID=2527966 RepID=A0A5C6D8A8_9BACT|nr:hypothetical protein Q31b_58910 [Novipirellula aureliae]
MRFNLTQCLVLVLVVALVMSLIVTHLHHQRQVRTLRDAIDDSRSTLRTIEYGAANLRLLELNPYIWENPSWIRLQKHELAFSILDHWRSQNVIDDVVGEPGYAMDFAADALSFFDCTSADEFVELTRNELSVYPDDPLSHATFELSDSELVSLDAFIRAATTPDQNGG